MNKGITKRRLLVGTAGLTAAAIIRPPMAVAADMPEHERALYAAARREGQLTWYTGQMQAEPSEAIGRAFTERYPGVRVNVVRSTSQVAFQRLSQDMRARVRQCDVFSSVDQSHLTFLKQEGHLLEYRPRNAEGLLDVVRRHGDPDGFFQVTYLALYMIGRRTDRVSEVEAPRTWQDILDPKWKDQLSIGHPGFSGAVGSWAVLMHKMYGVDYFKALERNKPQIGRSAADPVTLLNAGERTIGVVMPSATSLLSISRGNPIALIYPRDGTVMVPAPSGALKAAPHPNAAKLFMEYFTGPTYSQTVRQYFGESLRPDVPPPDGAKPLDQVNFLVPTPEEVETGIPEIREIWRDIFGV
jgi:iron(III) transport system substrate-binding protein